MLPHSRSLRPCVPHIRILEVHGASGHLAKTRLIPGLYRNLLKGKLEKGQRIRFVGRRAPSEWIAQMSSANNDAPTEFKNEVEALHEYLRRILSKLPCFEEASFRKFCEITESVQVDTRMSEHFRRLKAADARYSNGISPRKVMYLALMPEDYPFVLEGLQTAGLIDSRLTVIFEKPFAVNSARAKSLKAQAEKVLIPRGASYHTVDHYLFKAGVQDLLQRRALPEFILEWRRERISSFELSLFEQAGAEDREHFITTGVVADCLFHDLQVLATVGMATPKDWSAESVAAARLEFLESLSAVDPNNVVLGQYDKYVTEVQRLNEVRALGAARLLPLDKPTFFAGTFTSSLPQWNAAGKTPTIFAVRHVRAAQAKCTRLCAQFEPLDGIQIEHPMQRPQLVVQLDPAPFTWDLYTGGNVLRSKLNQEDFNKPDAYDELLAAALVGDWSWFPSAREALACLRICEPVLKERTEQPLCRYPVGGFGPVESYRAFPNWSLAPLQSTATI